MIVLYLCSLASLFLDTQAFILVLHRSGGHTKHKVLTLEFAPSILCAARFRFAKFVV